MMTAINLTDSQWYDIMRALRIAADSDAKRADEFIESSIDCDDNDYRLANRFATQADAARNLIDKIENEY